MFIFLAVWNSSISVTFQLYYKNDQRNSGRQYAPTKGNQEKTARIIDSMDLIDIMDLIDRYVERMREKERKRKRKKS